MSREDEAYKSLRRKLNKEYGTRKAYKAHTGDRTERYISENSLGQERGQTQQSQAARNEADAYNNLRQKLQQAYGPPRRQTVNPFDSIPAQMRTPGAQALWEMSNQGIGQSNAKNKLPFGNSNNTAQSNTQGVMDFSSLHQLAGLPGAVQQYNYDQYKKTQEDKKVRWEDIGNAITADKERREKEAKEALDMRPSYMKQQGQAAIPQDKAKAEDLMDTYQNGSHVEGMRNTAKPFNEYMNDLKAGRMDAQRFAEGVEKGRQATGNGLELSDTDIAQSALGGGQRVGASEQTAMLTDQEKQNYYYIAGTQGKKDAENYRQYVIENNGINEQIAQRNQEAIAREMAYQTPMDRFLFESGTQFVLGAGGALDNMSRVPAALTGDTSYRATGAGQYLSQDMVNAVDTSTLSGNVYKKWQQLMNTSGNNFVSIAGGAAFGPGVGSALFAAQAAGDAYQQVINEGGTVQQAQFYAGMQALDEEVTNWILGGIQARGGGFLKDMIGNSAFGQAVHKALQGVFTNNPVGLRIAEGFLDAIADGGSEALQEYTQYFTERLEKYLATGQAPTFVVDGKEMTWDQIVEAKGSAAWDVFANPEALESALMGFLNAELMNGIGNVNHTAYTLQRGGQLSQDAYQQVYDMVDPNITHYRKEDTYRVGKEAVELARDQQRRVEAGQGDSLMSRYGRGLMEQAAQEYQRQVDENEMDDDYDDEEKIRDYVNNRFEENARKNRALARLAFGKETAVDRMNRVRSELAGDTAQAAWETPKTDYGVREVTIPADMHEQYAQDMLNRGSADRLEWEGDTGEMVSLQRENDGDYTFTNERGETITLDSDQAIDLIPSGQPIAMYDAAGSAEVTNRETDAVPYLRNGTTAQTTAQTTATTSPSTAQTAPTTAASVQQGQAMTGEQRLAQLAGDAGQQIAQTKEAQRQAIYDAGKNRDSGFQSIMDGATMLTEAEKNAAFEQGMQASLNEIRTEGTNNGRTEEGNFVSGEGSGRDVSFRGGEQASGIPQAAGGTAETGQGRGILEQETGRAAGENGIGTDAGRTGNAWDVTRGFQDRAITESLDRSADRNLRGITADMLQVGKVVPARTILRTAIPGQTLVPVYGGNVPTLRKSLAMAHAYDSNIKVTPFISRGEIQVGGGESSRAFADPVRRQLGFRINDEDATSAQVVKHELIEFGIMDGKINVDHAFDLVSQNVPTRFLGDILYQYYEAQTKNIDFDSLSEAEAEQAAATAERHARKEMVCDIGAGIDQISGRIKNPDLKKLFESAHKIANKSLTSYLNERLNNAFNAETDENNDFDTELFVNDGIASDGVSMETENGLQFSEKLYKESGRDYLTNWLKKQSGISEQDRKDIVAQVDRIYDVMQEIKEEAGKDGISDYRAWAEITERNGRLTVITPNGEYPLNIDFATVCKKRKALDHILNTMVVDGNLEAKDLANADIVRLQNLIKEEGFEIACALCFVDSKRYRIGSWADGLVHGHKSEGKWQYGYNELVKSLVPKGSNLKIDQFNYTERNVKQPKGRLLKNAKDSQLDFTLINEVIAKNSKGSWNRTLATAIKEHPELRSLLNSAELLSSVGFDPIKVQNPVLFDVINNKGGTSKPKLSFSEVPYLNDILMSDAMTPEAAYKVGGVRVQSFSDFMANMVFDYVQMVSELQAKKLPAHAYTKEAAFVAMFGKTGIKINMSLVPKASAWSRKKINSYLREFKGKAAKEEALNKLKQNAGLDERGNYIWEDESFPYEVAMHFQADPEYAKNCGTIAVGVSDRHIIKLLNDDRIQMVIPYHKSGINPVVARLRNIDLYNDYTNYQNTRYADGTKLEAKDNTFDFYGSLAKTNDAKNTANEYLAWCKKNGYIPKFDQFKGHPNYYKLLADFRLYDETGSYAPQGAVKGIYPDNMKDLILNGYSYTDENGVEYKNGGLIKAQEVSDSLKAKTKDIIDRYNAGEGKIQNSSKLGSDEVTLPSMESESEEGDLQTKINRSMTMDQAKRMVQQAFNIGDIKAWFEDEYKNGDEWLAGEGADAVAMVIDNDYSLQQKYINKIQGILDDEFTIEDVLEAYTNKALTGTIKEKNVQNADLSKSVGYKDSRFYAPRTPSVSAETLNTANLRATASNKDQVNKARLDILLAAHNDSNITEKLGITQTELNKKLRTWSRYSKSAMSLAERLNSGVALENQWSGLQNCSIISQMNVSDDDINSMVKSITGTSRGNERNYIAKAILAADTHTDWSWLNFEFKTGRARDNDANVRGYFADDTIVIGGNAYGNTVAHEMGHALSNKWASDIMGIAPARGVDLADNLYNKSYIKDPDAKRFAEHFAAFMDSLTDVNDIRSEYTNRPGEVFARFFAKFVEWTNRTAGSYFFQESNYYKDQFTTRQYTEFVKLLQEKAALDAKQATQESSARQDIETAADDKNNPNVIRQGSEQDIQYSSSLFSKDISDKLKANMATFFSGTGTVDFALRNIVNHEFAVEYDAKIAAVYRANNGNNIYVDDVRNVNIDKHKGRVEYFHASPVCKNYSGAKNNAEELPLDLETAQATADAINTLQPKVVTVENVAKYRNSEAIKIIEEALEKNGYKFDKGVYRTSDFGGATIRERMFLRAVKEEGILPTIDTSEYTPMTWYDAVEDLIPELPKVSMPNFMAERLEPSGIDIDNLDQPIFILGGNKGRQLSYATADKPAPTILANSHDARIVLTDGTVLKATPRVMARIQGLPDAFDLKDSKGGMTNAYRVVGNGVPVQLTQGIVGPLLEENLIKQKSKETGIQYSSSIRRAEAYDEALKKNDMEKAAHLVKEAAAEAGYTEELYHGTRAFGFTKFDLKKMGDGASIFATSDSRIAETYSGETKRSLISERAAESDDAIINRIDGTKDEDLLPLIKKHLDDKYTQISKKKIEEMRKERVDDIRFYADKIMDFLDDNVDTIDEKTNAAATRLASSMYKVARAETLDEIEDLQRYYYDDAIELRYIDEDAYEEAFDGMVGVTTVTRAIRELNTLYESDVLFTNGKREPGSTLEVLTPGSARTQLIGELSKGIYHIYGKNRNMLEFDANGENWNQIETARIPNHAWKIKGSKFDNYNLTYNDAQNLAVRIARDLNGADDYLDTQDIRDELGGLRGWVFKSHKTKETIMELENLLPRRAMTRDVAKYARENGYDGVIIRNLRDSGGETPYNAPGDIYIYFNANAVKSADTVTYDDSGEVIPLNERFWDSKEDIRYSSKISADDAWLEDFDVDELIKTINQDSVKANTKQKRVDEVNKRLKKLGLEFNGTKKLGWTDERIDTYLDDGHYASTNKNYAQGYAAYISPMDFLKLTSGGKAKTVEWLEDTANGMGDFDVSKIDSNMRSPMFLIIGNEKGDSASVLSHEGRHRMILLGRAGFDQVPVLLFNLDNIYDKKHKETLSLKPQVFDENDFISKSRNVTIKDVVPFSSGNAEEIHEKFGGGSNADIRYSSKLNDSEYAPTFYSKLQREIQNFKGEKIGAASVESYLKGRGVKDEEIKWSGIKTFLEEKKSVNKQELMQYLRDNEMEIEQTVLDDNPVFIGPDLDGKEKAFRSIEEIQKLYADKYGEDVLMNEDYDDYMERYSFSIGDEDYSFSKESSGENETHWEGYRLDGGENYREILFRIPGSNYSNQAMSTHWNESGVLAHARVQDFETEDGGKVLFVEEIQSDWHNAKRNEVTVKDSHVQEKTAASGKPLYYLINNKTNKEISRAPQSEIESKNVKDIHAYLVEKTAVPDAPFHENYTDFVLKDLLRMAAEGDYDYLAWTTGKMQEERWSDEFAEGYRIEYDQQIPKFLKKYGKQWGAGLKTIDLNGNNEIADDTYMRDLQTLYDMMHDINLHDISQLSDGIGVLTEDIETAIEHGRILEKDEEKARTIAQKLDNAYNNGILTDKDIYQKVIAYKNSVLVPAITITDAMKESVLTEGQPMYSSKNKGDIDEAALDPRRVFISYNPDLQNAVKEISEVLKAYQELAPTQAEIKKVAKEIASKFGSKIKVDVATQKIETLYNFLAQGGKPDGREVLELAMDIGNDILDAATHGDPAIEKRWRDFKNDMKKRRIYISKDRVADLNPDGIKALRRQWKGKMLFTTDEKYRERYGQIHYIELQQQFPEYFTKPAEEFANDIDAIEEIMLAFDAQAPIYEKIYTGATRDEAALEIAYDIMQGYFGNERAEKRFKKIYRDYVKPIKDRAIDDYRDKLRSIQLKDAAAIEQRSIFDQIKGIPGTYVVNEKALKDVDAQGRRAMLERVRESAEKEKERYKEQVEKIKMGYIDRSQKDKLLRLAKELRAMKGGPDFEQAKQELIGNLDLVAKGISTNYERKLMEMKQEYEQLKSEDENFEPDRATLKKIERLQKKQINQLSSYEITALIEAILKMKEDQWTHNRMIRETDAALVADEGRKIVSETNALKGTKDMNKIADAIDGYSLAHLNSKRAFRKMSGYNDKAGLMKLWNELNDGQHKVTDFKRRAVTPFDEFMSKAENKDFIIGMFDPTVEITSSRIETKDKNGKITGVHEPQTVMITPAMKISIYLHSLNQDNREHAKYGGFRIPNMAKYERGDYANAYGQGSKIVRLTKSDMKRIAESLTPQEKAFADLAHDYFNVTSKEAINATSMLLDGYEKASVENYMPIKTDPNFTKKDITGLIQDGTIEGQGWTKERNEMAKNPILLEDITQVLQRSIDGAALYCGLAIPVRNFNKVYAFQHSGYKDSVREAIMQTFGKRGTEYIEKLLRDLQGGNMDAKDAAGKWVDRFTSGLRGNYAQAVLTLNPSVAIKQAASYPTAAARLGFEPLRKALAKLSTSTTQDMDLINKYTPLLWNRTQGQSSDALAEVSKRKDKWQYNGGVEKVFQAFNWIQNIDVKTVKTLWYASEYYVQDNMPAFKKGTEAYYREVAKVFNEVVEDTQPNYSVMQRASLSRVDNEIVKSVFMFMTQPLQNFGILYDSIMNYQAKRDAFKQAVKNGFEGGALTDYAADMAFARQGMMRSVSAVTVATLVFSAMTQIAKFLLHRLDPLRDKETGELTAESMLKSFFANSVESLMGMMAGAGEIYSLLMAMTTGSYLDDLSVSGIDSLNQTLSKILKTSQTINKIRDDEETTTKQKIAASIVASRDLALQIAELTGIPANNAKKIAEALINHYNDLIDPLLTGKKIDWNLESGTKITDKQYANRALKYYNLGDVEKGNLAASKTKDSAIQSALGAKGEKDANGNQISNSKKYDAIDRIMRTGGNEESQGQLFAAAYPSDELSDYMFNGGSPYDFMHGQKLAQEIAGLPEDERQKRLYSFVEETGYTLEQKKAWLVSDKDRVEGKKYQAWKGVNGSGWDFIKHMSNMEKISGDKNQDKREKIVSYIKRQTNDKEKQKALFVMGGYQLDSTEKGKKIKDGNFNNAFGYKK